MCEETLCPPLVSPEVRRINTRITRDVLVGHLLILTETESNQKMQQNVTYIHIAFFIEMTSMFIESHM